MTGDSAGASIDVNVQTDSMGEMMKEKMRNNLCQILNAVIIAGVIILFMGLYYCVVKAGIPYQDPPLDLRIQYEVNAGIGSLLVANGFKMILCGGITRLLFGLIYFSETVK